MAKSGRKSLRLPKGFLADLESVFEADASDDISAPDLRKLGQRLTKWSENCRRQLNRELSKLPTDHPVNCSISLYGAMEMGRLEVAHTRTLAWLLDPNKREHGFGHALLNAMLTRICGCGHLSSRDVCKVEAERVYRNSLTEDAGRTDIWIEGKPRGSNPWLLVIEAKIDASESDQQLDRYNAEIKKWQATHPRGEIRRVFLTTDGVEAKSGQDWTSATFAQLARVFWHATRLNTAQPGYHFLRYYLAGVLQNILGLPVGCVAGQQNPYELLAFLKKPLAT